MATKNAKDATVVKSLEELKAELQSKRNDLLEARKSHAAGELVNPKVLSVYRKDIARLLTQINAKESK